MRALIAVSLFALATSAAAQLYRWTDDGGAVHYTDTPPPASAKNVQKKESARPAAAPQKPYALEQATKNFPVTVYTSKDCGDPCKKGLDFLKKRGVPYAEKVISTQEEIDQLTKLAGAPRVPVLTVGTVVQKDFEAQAWNEALDTAGYPKTATP